MAVLVLAQYRGSVLGRPLVEHSFSVKPLAILLVLSGCTPKYIRPVGAVPFVPPAIYALWAADVSHCAHLLDRTQDGKLFWFVVPGISFPCKTNGESCGGLWWPELNGTRTIYLPQENVWVESTVKHEVLHDGMNLPPNTPVQHPSPPFKHCELIRSERVK